MEFHFRMKQYEFCRLCKINHRDGQRHVYNRTHQLQVQKQLSREKQKYEDFKRLYQKEAYPVFIDGANVMEHLAQKQHKYHVVEFLRSHRVKQYQKACFILSEDEIQYYKKNFNTFWIHLPQNQKDNDVIVNPSTKETTMPLILFEDNKSSISVPSMPTRPPPTSSDEAHLEYMISRSKVLKAMGKKRFLLPGRVGATAHSTVNRVNEHWLPNYGGLWNTGPRKKTREAFYQTKVERKESSL